MQKQISKVKKLNGYKKTSSLASPFDPNGSYTGVSVFDKNQKPQQDADDL